MNYITQHDVLSSLGVVRSECAKLKTGIFGHIAMGKDFPSRNISSFKSALNDELKKWEDIGDDIEKDIKKIKIPDDKKFRVLRYAAIKDIVYASYDYASILKFLDGILTGIKDNKFENADDIEDFFAHTTNMAFKLNADNVGELLDDYLNRDESNITDVDAHEKTMFKNLQDYSDLIPHGDRAIIYKSIEKIIDSLVDVFTGPDYSIPKGSLSISVVNQVVEYIIYTVAVYMLRLYTIGKYIRPYDVASYSDDEEPKSETVQLADPEDMPRNAIAHVESVGEEDDEDDKKDDEPITLLKDFDHMTIRDINSLRKFTESMFEMLRAIGVKTDDLPDRNRRYVGLNDARKTIFYTKYNLEENPLHRVIKDDFGNEYGEETLTSGSITIKELHHNLKCALYNKYQGFLGTSTPKNEILAIIASQDPSKSLSECRTIAHDLYILVLVFGNSIVNQLKALRNRYNGSGRHDDISTLVLGDQKLLAECYDFILGFYHEFMLTVLQKARHIEMAANDHKKLSVDNVMKLTKFDDLLTTVMMPAVPSTMRVPIDLQDHYTTPIFEALEMYDEYLRSLPEFENNEYLTEAGLASIMNAIIAFLQGIFNQINVFSKTFKPAVAWVTKNAQELSSLKFLPNARLDPYIEYKIGPIDDYVAGLVALKNIDLKEAAKNIDNFTKSLYGKDDTMQTKIYGWFSTDGAKAAIRLRNAVIFGDTNGSEQEIQPGKLEGGANIQKALVSWINDVKNSEAILRKLVDTNKILLSTVTALKNKASSNINEGVIFENEDSSGTSTGNPSGQKDSTSSNQNTQAKTSDTSDGNKAGNNSAYAQLLGKVQNAMNNMWKIIYQGVIEALRNEYQYIKRAYDNRIKETNSQGKNDAT